MVGNNRNIKVVITNKVSRSKLDTNSIMKMKINQTVMMKTAVEKMVQMTKMRMTRKKMTMTAS